MPRCAAGCRRRFVVSHLPRRPSWECRACGEPWPCQPACTILDAQYRDAPGSRHTYLTDMAAVAAFDLRSDGGATAPAVNRILAAREAA